MIASAQTDSDIEKLNQIQLLGNRSLVAFRKQVRDILTDRELVIENTIRYRVIARPWANARAFTTEGVRRIEIGAGMLLVYEAFSVALAAQKLGDSACGQAYIVKLVKDLASVDYLVNSGQTPPRLIDVFEFARRRQPLCRGVTFRAFADSENLRSYQEAMLGQSLGFIVAHELGHHLYNVRNPDGDLALSRENEKRADRLALRFVSRNGVEGIFYSFPAILHLAAMGGTAEEESLRTHPSGFRRALLTVEAMDSLYSNDLAFRESARLKGKSEQWEQFLQSFQDVLREALDEQ